MTTSDRTTMRVHEHSPAEPPGAPVGEASGGHGGGPPLTPQLADREPPPRDEVEWQDRLALRNWTLPVKLAAVLLVPTVFVVSLGILRIVEQTEKASSYDGVEQAVGLENRTSTLLGDLAAERTAAGVYVASNRAGGPQALQGRIDASTAAAADVRQAALTSDGLDDQARSAYRQAATELGQLDRLRGDVLGGRVDPSGVIARYTEATSGLLTFDQSLSREAADPSVAGLSTGLYSLSLVREQDAFVEAVVAAGLAAGRIDAPSIDQARNATLRRTIAVDDFRTAVGTDNSALAGAVVGPDVNNRDLLAQVVLGRGSAGLPLQVSGPEWSRASQAVEQRVSGASDQVRRQLQDNAAALQNSARNSAGVASVVLLLALLAGAAVVYFVTRSLLRPLRLLRRSALDVAERRLPGAVRSLREGEAPDTTIEPTPITTREEIGQVARAFDQVHEQAVRLAAEQAGLRAAFNSIFINLSRRSQALVERQLRLIEQLENNEEDPESLSNLFQLDHLATRMRRNSENLLVLSGTDLSRRGSRPVPLVDVLRAGASEVEQYQRVDLAPPPTVMLLGGTASDVVHLVAELLENATTFSAPDTRVEIRASQGADGGVLVEILDEGVGMSDDDLREANTRLHSPPTVDVSASRRMGLFVVGRLATRHGIAVSLRSREQAGVVASAVVPPSSVLASAPSGNQRGGARALPTPPPTNGSAPYAPALPAQDRGPGGSAGSSGSLPRREGPTRGTTPGTFFAPSGEAGEPSDAPRTNGSHHANGLLPRRGAPTNGTALPAERYDGPVNGHGHDEFGDVDDVDNEDDDADDVRTAATPEEDAEGVTLWRRGDDADGSAETTETPETTGPEVDGTHATPARGTPSGPGADQRRPGPPAGYGPPPPGPRGPWAPPGPQQGAPYPPPPGAPGPGQRPAGPTPWRGPDQPSGAPAPSHAGQPTQSSAPPMWNGAPVVPPPGEQASDRAGSAEDLEGTETPEPSEVSAADGDAAPPRRTLPLRRRTPRASPGSVRPEGYEGTGDDEDAADPDRDTPSPRGEGTGARIAGAAALGALGAAAAGSAAGSFAGDHDDRPAGTNGYDHHGSAPTPPHGSAPAVPAAHGAPAPADPSDASPEAPDPDGDPDAGPRPLGRRRGRTGNPAVPGTAPRMRPRRSSGAPDDGSDGPDAGVPGAPAPRGEAPAEELFAPSVDADNTPGTTEVSRPVNGNGSNAAHGRTRPAATRPAPDRVPPRAGTPTREKTPIFDEVASVWFREAPPSAPAAGEEEWATTGDAGWRAAAASTEDVDAGTTEAGLPRRRPRARLVPGAAGTGVEAAERPAPADAEPAGPGGSRRDADAIRGRLASYQQGVSDGRTTRRGRLPDTGGHEATGARPVDEEEQ